MQDNIKKLLNKHDIVLSDNELASIDTNDREKTLMMVLNAIFMPPDDDHKTSIRCNCEHNLIRLHEIVNNLHFLVNLNNSKYNFDAYLFTLALEKGSVRNVQHRTIKNSTIFNPESIMLTKMHDYDIPQHINQYYVMQLILKCKFDIHASTMIQICEIVMSDFEILKREYGQFHPCIGGNNIGNQYRIVL